MKVVGKKVLFEFTGNHSDATEPVSAWIAEAEEACWKTPHDVKARYATASPLADNHVVFNIKGNKYRLETKIDYQRQIVLAKRIGTHAEYSRWQPLQG